MFGAQGLGFRVWRLGFGIQVPNNEVLGLGVIVIMIQVSGKYMIIRYLDPQGGWGLGFRVFEVVANWWSPSGF